MDVGFAIVLGVVVANKKIWRHIQPGIQTADVWIELTQGSGLLHLRLDWTPGAHTPIKTGLFRTNSIRSLKDSPNRFSPLKSFRRDAKEGE